MSEEVQPGVRIDSELWQRFREDIKARKGCVRGNLRTEVENAFREYLKDEPSPTEQRIDARLSRIEDAVGIAGTDGGTDLSTPNTRTHAEQSDTVEKPAPNAAGAEKVKYLAQLVVEDYAASDDPGRVVVQKSTLRGLITDEYDFGDRTIDRYYDRLVDKFDLWEHPRNEELLLGPDEYDSAVEDIRENEREKLKDD